MAAKALGYQFIGYNVWVSRKKRFALFCSRNKHMFLDSPPKCRHEYSGHYIFTVVGVIVFRRSTSAPPPPPVFKPG